MIGGRSIAVATFAAIAVGAAAARGLLDPSRLQGLTAAACIALGLFAGGAAALLTRVMRRGAGRELPPIVQRGLLVAAFGCLGTAAFSNAGIARVVGLPEALAKPSKSAFCPPPKIEEAKPAAAPVQAAAEPAGCSLVKRAYALGYAKSLGSCAPRALEVAAEEAPIKPIAPCERRKLDEPYLHFAARKLAGLDLEDADPIGAVEHRVDDFRTRFDHLDVLVGRLLHAVQGSGHAAHHVWIAMPDPRPSSGSLLSRTKCDERYADLPVWPSWDGVPRAESALVEHVLGQLLFATRFGKPPASCRDVSVHWDAPADACARLIADPIAFLDDQGALASVRDVLDRRQRQIEVRALADQLHERMVVPDPPAPGVVVSLQCLAVDPSSAGKVTTTLIDVDGAPIEVREVRVPSVITAGAGPIDVYAAMSSLLAGGTIAAAKPAAPVALDAGYLLTQLDGLEDADPFLGARWPLERGDLIDVYPFHRHLNGFVEAFRRRYRAQRGRL